MDYKYLTVAEYDCEMGTDIAEVVYETKEELDKELKALREDTTFFNVKAYELRRLTNV
jgi:hypothetical protein